MIHQASHLSVPKSQLLVAASFRISDGQHRFHRLRHCPSPGPPLGEERERDSSELQDCGIERIKARATQSNSEFETGGLIFVCVCVCVFLFLNFTGTFGTKKITQCRGGATSNRFSTVEKYPSAAAGRCHCQPKKPGASGCY
nr:hypothetical protein Iba_chr14dCG14600 [Ipomoea batatas]